MQKYDVIDEGIMKHDIFLLREALGNICYMNRNFSNGEFDYYLEHIEKKGVVIRENQLEGKLISEGITEYTEEDFERAVFELKENFCDERIADVKKIGRALYGKPKQTAIPNSTSKNPGTLPKGQSHQKKEKTKYIGLLVAVIIVVVIMCLIKKM